MKHLLSLALMGAGACALCVMPSFQKHPLQRKFFHRCFAHRGLFDNQTPVKTPYLLLKLLHRQATASSWICR